MQSIACTPDYGAASLSCSCVAELLAAGRRDNSVRTVLVQGQRHYTAPAFPQSRLFPYLCMQSALATLSRKLRHMHQPTACTTAQPWYDLLLDCDSTCTTPAFGASDSATLISCRLDSLNLQLGFGNNCCTGNNCW